MVAMRFQLCPCRRTAFQVWYWILPPARQWGWSICSSQLWLLCCIPSMHRPRQHPITRHSAQHLWVFNPLKKKISWREQYGFRWLAPATKFIPASWRPFCYIYSWLEWENRLSIYDWWFIKRWTWSSGVKFLNCCESLTASVAYAPKWQLPVQSSWRLLDNSCFNAYWERDACWRGY